MKKRRLPYWSVRTPKSNLLELAFPNWLVKMPGTSVMFVVPYITLMLWIILLMLGKVFASMLIGWQIIKIKGKGFWRLYGGFALGALILSILCLIPFVGWFIKAVVVLIALGAIIMAGLSLHESLGKKKTA